MDTQTGLGSISLSMAGRNKFPRSVMNVGIYKISIGPRSFYYGSSVSLSTRKYAHLYALKNNRHTNIRMQRAWNKHQIFTFEIIEECSIEDLLHVEQKYLDTYFSHKYNMNIASTSTGGCGPVLTDEHRKKISKTLSGRTLSEETKQKLRRKKSEATRERMKKAQQNKPLHIRSKISNTLKGHGVSKETREKIRQKCRKLSDEQIREIKRLDMSSNITQTQLAQQFNVSRSLISMILSGKVWAEVA